MEVTAETQQSPYYYELTDDMKTEITAIEEIFKTTKLPRRANKNNFKASTGYGLSEAFGFIRKRNRCPGPSRNNVKYPELWKALQKLGSLLPISYDAVQVNFNCVCAPHRDAGNYGLSFLVSGGDYEGGELITEMGDFNAKYRGLIFDGSAITHSNKTFSGTFKWTLVFFSVIVPSCKSTFFPIGFRTEHPYYRDRFLDTLPHKETLYFPNGRKDKNTIKNK